MRFKSTMSVKEINEINNFTAEEIKDIKERSGFYKAKKEGKMNPLPSL